MTTANADLKAVVRNWISRRIETTNDNFLANHDYVKFHKIEDQTATTGVYSTILKDTDTTGQIEFIDTLDEDNDGKWINIEFLNEEEDYIEVYQDGVGFVDCIPWSPEAEQSARELVDDIVNKRLDAVIAQRMIDDPENAEKHEKMKTIRNIDILDTSQPDNHIKVVGLNMFNDAVQSLEDSITSSNGNVGALTNRIAELEKRLAALISAFEEDETPELTATNTIMKYVEIIENESPMTIQEAIEFDRLMTNINSSNVSMTENSEQLLYADIPPLVLNQTDNETKNISDLYTALRADYQLDESFTVSNARSLYNGLVEQYSESQSTPANATAYMELWQNLTSDDAQLREAFEQKLQT